MSASSAPGKSSRRRTASAARGRPRPRARSSGRWRRLLRVLWDLLPFLLLLLVFAMALTFDPEAVMRLIWACVSGTFGKPVQITGAVTLFSIVAVAVWAFWPVPASVPDRGKNVRRPARHKTSGNDASASGEGDAGTPKRRSRNRTTPDAAVAPEALEPVPTPPNPPVTSRTRSTTAGNGKTTRSKTPRESSPSVSPKQG
jgi:hypothetical protein